MDASQSSFIPWASSAIQSRRSPQQAASSQAEQPSESGDSGQEALSSPEKVARYAAEFLGIELSRDEIATWGNRVHWVYGTQWGVAYMLLRRKPGPVSGLLFGSALWLASDELLLWALGIAEAPTNYPLSSHVQALVAHGVYGMTVGIAARGLHAR
jgi:hypothetical protein